MLSVEVVLVVLRFWWCGFGDGVVVVVVDGIL